MVYEPARVRVGERCGWVRVVTEPGCGSSAPPLGPGGGSCGPTWPPGTLVYLAQDTQVTAICQDLVLPSNYTIWLQYGGGDGRCLEDTEKPLAIQDQFLTSLGYSDYSRRARLGIDPDLRFLITFYIGPRCTTYGGPGGSAYLLKGLVVPQWRRREISIIGNVMFIHPVEGSKVEMEKVDLDGAEVESSPNSKCGRNVLRVSGKNRQVFLGFDQPWERQFWHYWLIQGSEKGGGGERLDLSGNDLCRVPDSLGLSWPGLRELDLSRNRLEAGPQALGPLSSLRSLRALSLAANALSALPQVVLALDNLTVLDLSDNDITYLPPELADLPWLETLKLDRNLLRGVPRGSFRSLQTLSLSHNRLETLPEFLSHPLMRTLNLLDAVDSEKENENKNGIGVVRPEDLKTVNLRANLLKGNIILGNYGNLTQLDVSENSIESLDLTALDKLQNVQCSRNKLQDLSLNGSSLTSLIAGNNNLKNLTISPKPSKLKHLDISYNSLEKLPEWLGACHHLRTLFASHNNLASLPDHLFCSELSCLQTLQLSFNKLATLPQVIRHIPLQQLFLQSNQISSLPQHFFLASSRMKILNLTKNCLEELPSAIGDGHQLERLYLTANKITTISALTRFTNLRVLHVAYNNVTHLPDVCVGSWPDMEELVLSGNRIDRLPGSIGQWQHLRVLRLHSNQIIACPSLSLSTSLRVLDLANNQLDRVSLTTLVPKQLQFLDISGNSRLHVDPKQFQAYRTQRKVSLVDVSGQNRDSLPSMPHHQEINPNELNIPWTLGFSETAGQRDRLCISQLRLTAFCNTEALLGLFDAGNNTELPQLLSEAIPRILLEERTVKETACDYMKYTLLSAHRELKEKGQRCGVCAMVCHICRERGPGARKCTLRIASVGEAKAVLSRKEGTLTLAHVPTQLTRSQIGSSAMFPLVVPDPHVTELTLRDNDEFIIIANKRLWEVLNPDDAVSEVKNIQEPVLAAKRLQDLAQSYGVEDNLSIIVLRFHQSHQAQLIRELNYTLQRTNDSCWCDGEGDRSSPSGQSEQASCNKPCIRESVRQYVADKTEFLDCHNYQSVLMRENGTRKMSAKLLNPDGHLADCEESSSERSGHLSEEQFRCWEYMLEQNTQMLFDKELDTLSRGLMRRSVPVRQGLWARTRSNPHLDNDPQQPFLSRQFGSARSFQQGPRLGGSRRSINGGPNAAYFGSLQRLMPYHLEYDFSVIKERSELDSLETEDRMHKYWDVATTEL